MADRLDPHQIPPHVAPGQLWLIDGTWYRILFVGGPPEEVQVIYAAYLDASPLTWTRASYAPEPLARFCQRTHNKSARLVEGDGAPWPG